MMPYYEKVQTYASLNIVHVFECEITIFSFFYNHKVDNDVHCAVCSTSKRLEESQNKVWFGLWFVIFDITSRA